ncbi:PaaI family thioesterase [Polluticoccus soli]|uniref:PaaI family thioesterase n=2 Tax=Chitinophagaceae TaxID=563835 RepID=UPI0023E0F36F|nr:PaaI family thioesterase [Flavipsychrobacter sp. JY13-12]
MGYKEAPAGQVLHYIKDNFLGKKITDSRSPAGNWLEFTLEHIEKGKATISLEVKYDMTNPYGNIHGGMMALVMDEVIGWSVVSLDTDNHYTSLNLNVDFLYAIKQGDRLRATAEVIREGKKIIHVECRVEHTNGTLLGKASSNLIVTGMKPRDGDSKVAN